MFCKTERSRSRWPAKGYPGSFKNMEKHELLKYALEHGMINVSYSEVFDEWNDRRLPICGDFFAFIQSLAEYPHF